MKKLPLRNKRHAVNKHFRHSVANVMVRNVRKWRHGTSFDKAYAAGYADALRAMVFELDGILYVYDL